MNKNDQLGNLLESRKFSQQQDRIAKNTDDVKKEFDRKSSMEKANLYLKYLGYRHDIRYITDYQKLAMMGYWEDLRRRNNQKQ